MEAIGWASVGRYQLELAINIIIAILGSEQSYAKTFVAFQPFEAKLKYLSRAPRSRLLKHDWWRSLRSIAAQADELNREYSDAATAIIYSRGGGRLEEALLPLADKMNLSPRSPGMTPLKLQDVAERFRILTGQAAELASVMLPVSEKMALFPHP